MSHFKTELEVHLDTHFPKGQCKERGAALMLFAEALRLHGISKYSKKQMRARAYNVGYYAGRRIAFLFGIATLAIGFLIGVSY